MATGPATRSFRIKSDLGILPVRFYNADATLSAGDLIVDDTDGTVSIVADSNTKAVLGVVAEDCAAGEYGALYIAGEFEVNGAAVDFACGGHVYAASASTVDTGSQTDLALGKIINCEPTNGQAVIKFVLCSTFFNTLTHA